MEISAMSEQEKIQEGINAWAASCAKIPVGVYAAYCFGRSKKSPTVPWALKDTPVTIQDIVSLLCALGNFEPAGAHRPGICDIVTSFDDIVEVPPAAIDANGEITASTKVLIKICAPEHRSLIVDFLEGIAANLTAWESGEVFSKSMQVAGFSEMFCPPGEPGPGSSTDEGVFSNIRRIVLCPGAGFDLSARNHDPYSPALFHVKAVMWSTC
jgi:hypothetical protein